MVTKNEIIESIKYVVDNSTYVKIKKENIYKATALLKESKKDPWLNSDVLDLEKYSDKDILMYLIICESLNFCYWDSDIKWKIEYKDNWYSGSFGLFYGIAKAINNGYDLLNIDYLDKLTIKEFDEMLKGTTSIPLLEERFNVLKQLVKELKKVDNLIDTLDANDDVELLNNIVSNFSNFRDISSYKGHDVYFFKRAILLVGDIIANVKSIGEHVKNDDNMTGCADYKIPQVLRHLNILEYNEELSSLIDSKTQIDHDSEMEIEIRANMLYVVELIKEELHNNNINMNSVQIDNALWLLSKNKEFKDKPHHLSKTIYY